MKIITSNYSIALTFNKEPDTSRTFASVTVAGKITTAELCRDISSILTEISRIAAEDHRFTRHVIFITQNLEEHLMQELAAALPVEDALHCSIDQNAIGFINLSKIKHPRIENIVATVR